MRWSAACVLAVLVGTVPAAGQDAVELSGEIRSRFEYGDPAGGEADGFTLLRTRAGLTAGPVEYARIFVQVQDSRIWGEERSTLDGVAEAFDLHQGWVELFDRWAEHRVGLRVGRQEIALGNERLVGPVGWSNVGRSFDGARVDVEGPGGWWRVTGFVTTLSESDRPPAGSGDTAIPNERDDHTFAGLTAAFQSYELFLFQDLNLELPGTRRTAGLPIHNVDRTTVGGRLHRRMGRFSYELEGAYQLGDRVFGANVAQKIRAWMAAGRVELEMEEESGPLRGLGLGLDWLSGDPDDVRAGEGDYQAFDVLYHTGHRWYGYMDLFGDPAARTDHHGLVDALATVRTIWGDRHPVPVTATVHRFSLADDTGLEASDLGWELDVKAPYALGDAGSVEAGYSVFFAGDAAPEIGLADGDEIRHWFYLQLSIGF